MSAAKKHYQQYSRTVGDNIRDLRIKRKIDRDALASKAGVGTIYMGRVEDGLICPTNMVVQKIAKVLRCTQRDIYPADSWKAEAD